MKARQKVSKTVLMWPSRNNLLFIINISPGTKKVPYLEKHPSSKCKLMGNALIQEQGGKVFFFFFLAWMLNFISAFLFFLITIYKISLHLCESSLSGGKKEPSPRCCYCVRKHLHWADAVCSFHTLFRHILTVEVIVSFICYSIWNIPGWCGFWKYMLVMHVAHYSQ